MRRRWRVIFVIYAKMPSKLNKLKSIHPNINASEIHSAATYSLRIYSGNQLAVCTAASKFTTAFFDILHISLNYLDYDLPSLYQIILLQRDNTTYQRLLTCNA